MDQRIAQLAFDRACDRLWGLFPRVRPATFALESHGPVEAFRMGFPVFGRGPMLEVRAFRVGSLLVDAGTAGAAPRLLGEATGRGVREVILTHHHEDHTGGAAAMAARGLSVRGSAGTQRLLAAGFTGRLYQHLAWGRAVRADVGLLPARIETDGLVLDVHPAPGHAADMVVFHAPREGWLFSGDAFLAERVRVFRGDEDFAASIETLRRLCKLDFEALWCAHRPRPTGGRTALLAKLDWLVEIDGRVRERAAQGASVRAIARELFGKRDRFMSWLSFGDATPENLVRAVLRGARPRPDVALALG